MADDETPKKTAPSDNGEEGGAPSQDGNRLKLSELAVLRQMASRFPFTPEDRIRAVGFVNDAISSGKARLQVAGVKAMVAMENVSLKEVALLIGSQRVEVQKAAVNVKVNVTNLAPSDLKILYDARQRLIAGDQGIRDGSGDGDARPAG